MKNSVISIASLLEAVSNPDGRFRSLEGIYPERDDAGEVRYAFRRAGSVVDVQMQWRGRPCELTFYLCPQGADAAQWHRLTGFLQTHPVSWRVPTRFLEKEVLLFDAMDRPFYADVVFSEPSSDEAMSVVLNRYCRQEDHKQMKRLFHHFCQMGVALLEEGSVHGDLKPSNLRVTAQVEVQLVHYEQMRLPDSVPENSHAETPDCEVASGFYLRSTSTAEACSHVTACLGNVREEITINDEIPARVVGIAQASASASLREMIAIANIALGLKVLCAAPAMYRALNGDTLFRTPVLRSSLLPIFREMARQVGATAVENVIDYLSQSGTSRLNKAMLCRLLEALDEESVELVWRPAQRERLRGVSSQRIDRSGSIQGDHATAQKPDFSGYDWVSVPREGLLCVQKGEKWGYLYSDGTQALALQYDWADDFREGRAVVKLGEQFGLIDKQGVEVIPIRYESVDWDCEHSIACVCDDGQVGLWNRSGSMILKPQYDWMGAIRQSELLLVCRDGLCGYIRPTGQVAIDLQYEEASDFGADALARVVRQGREFYIDARGNEVPPLR